MNNTLRALVADDSEGVRFITVGILLKLGYSVTEARDGAEALALFRDALTSPLPYDLLVTDNKMPKLHGIEVAEQIRAMGQDTPIVLVSGTLTEEIEVRAKELEVKTLEKGPYSVMGPKLREILDSLLVKQ